MDSMIFSDGGPVINALYRLGLPVESAADERAALRAAFDQTRDAMIYYLEVACGKRSPHVSFRPYSKQPWDRAAESLTPEQRHAMEVVCLALMRPLYGADDVWPSELEALFRAPDRREELRRSAIFDSVPREPTSEA